MAFKNLPTFYGNFIATTVLRYCPYGNMLWQLFSDIRCPPFETNANRTILTEEFPFSTRLDCPPGLTFKNGLTNRLVECVRPYKWNTNDFMCRGEFFSGNWA